MTKNPVSLDEWRDYFSSSNSDIISIIEHAIMVAASDCPYDFKVKRDRIAEMLFTSKCLGCDRTELSVAHDDCLKTGVEAGGSKDSKEKSSSRDEIEEESEFVDDSEGKSAAVVRRLQLSVEILESTEIGKSVNALRKHGSKQIRNLCRRLVEWVEATTAIVGIESAKTSAVEEKQERKKIQLFSSSMFQKKAVPQQQEKLKLEAAKRKLHERYQEAENAKKQRTIQVVDLPNQSLAHTKHHHI